ncbi:2-C-methyl-D-erythritol 4-phosphate cytidylyltransferase [Mailhella massiliensis]|uniref:Bifunctional enzyme IspD/IspF n=1 Tax=Mailhella massiliensis TaxID=1903261 RepID=A0A921DS25_9BACT|nr:2-C-methyl-D-erythritol 4-phosphate cytidylyltransferase [Mailhella massiliensis]HJD97713.1 2-C-methyl-D-erythritol 4-phosphate cytidylyltransferase [Mailhella massiliensis]
MQHECWGVILAAGQGTRMAEATGGKAKQFLPYKGAPLWWSSAKAMAASPLVHGLVLVFPEGRLEEAREEALRLNGIHSCGVPFLFAEGGARRQDSVRRGLEALPGSCEKVLVHDGARPFVSTALVTKLALSLDEEGLAGAVPGLAVTDTVKETDAAGLITRTPPRETLRAVQTPQAFFAEELRAAHARAEKEGWLVTDDASLMERCGKRVRVVEGEARNVKITKPEDLALLAPASAPLPCCGYGYDVHAYGGNRPLMLGGVEIGGEYLIHAHSDGDVLLHALMDAVLGCFGGGDIGRLFPDNDPAFENIPSSVLLDHVLTLAAEAGVRLVHADLTVVAQKPKIAPHAEAVRRNLSRLLGLPPDHIGFKATTEEKLGFTGELKGIKAVALVTALRESA